MNDALMVQKGLNALLEEGHNDFMLIKGDILDNDLDLAFDTVEEFELRLEDFENGWYDPDIEKILGIGGRKAGTWNPLGRKAKMNRAGGRKKEESTQADYEADDNVRSNISRSDFKRDKKGNQRADASMKGRQPGGKARGAGGGYKGGDLSDRDTFAGALARKVVGAKNKASKLKPSDPRRAIGKKVGQGKDAAADAAKAAGSAAASGARAAGSATASGARVAGSAAASGGRAAGRTAAGVGTGVGNVASDLGSATARSYRGENKGSSSHSGLGSQRGGTGGRPGTAGSSNTPNTPGKIGGNKPASQSGGYLNKADLDAIWEAFEESGFDIEKAGK